MPRPDFLVLARAYLVERGWRIVISGHNPLLLSSLLTFGMRDLIIVFVHVFTTIARLARRGGVRSVLAESVLLKHQLLILNRSAAERRTSACVTGSSPESVRFSCGQAASHVRPSY